MQYADKNEIKHRFYFTEVEGSAWMGDILETRDNFLSIFVKDWYKTKVRKGILSWKSKFESLEIFF